MSEKKYNLELLIKDEAGNPVYNQFFAVYTKHLNGSSYRLGIFSSEKGKVSLNNICLNSINKSLEISFFDRAKSNIVYNLKDLDLSENIICLNAVLKDEYHSLLCETLNSEWYF